MFAPSGGAASPRIHGEVCVVKIKDQLARIAEALERLAPAAAPEADLSAARLFRYEAGEARFAPAPDYPLDIALLVGVDRQKNRFAENLSRFARGLPFNHVLLWGSRGAGKSSISKAAFMAGAVPDPQKRATITGYASAAMNLSGVIFSTVGGKLAANGMLADPVNGWTKGYLLGFITLACIVVEIICLPGGQKAQEGPAPAGAETAKKGGVPAIVYLISIHYLVWFCFMYCYGLNISDYIINVYKLGDGGTAGIATAMVTVGGVLAGLFFGQYSKVTKSMNVPIMMALTFVGMFLCIIAPTIPGVIVGGFLCGFAMSGCNPYIMMMFGQLCPPSQLTQAMSIFSGCMNVGMFIALYVLNGLSSLIFGADYTLDKKFLLAAIMCAVCAVTGIFIYGAAAKQAKKAMAEAQAPNQAP